MTKPNTSLTKTCQSCGKQKPLSAFLQLGGKEGTLYGSICSACRSTQKDRNLVKDKDESSRTSTSVTISTKEKVKGEQDQKEQRHQIEEDYYKEREKDQQITKTQELKVEITKDEKKLRDLILGRRATESTAKTTKTEPRTEIERAAQQAFNTEQTTKQEVATKADQKEKEIDLTSPVEETRFGELERHRGLRTHSVSHASILRRAFANPQQSTNPVKTAENQNTPTEPVKRDSSSISRSFLNNNQKPEQKKEQDNRGTPSDFIRNEWGPGSKKR